jgi:N-acetylglucosaminyldiphosphoundecaprenol N-acetyl-beta-D-mannosaminyltransferase
LPQVSISRWSLVLGRLRTFDGDSQVDRLLDEMASREVPVTVAFVNAHVMNEVVGSTDLADYLRDFDYLLRDGVGVSILLRLIGREPGGNLNGTDLIPKLLERARGKRLALLGTREPYLGAAARAICNQIGSDRDLLTIADGFQEPQRYVDLVLENRPQFIILGMGVPKQERVAAILRARLDYGCVIVCGGAILDFYSGKVGRAPPWLRAMRLEWLFRLAAEPKRLFTRYVIGNPVFLLRSAKFWWTGDRSALMQERDVEVIVENDPGRRSSEDEVLNNHSSLQQVAVHRRRDRVRAGPDLQRLGVDRDRRRLDRRRSAEGP